MLFNILLIVAAIGLMCGIGWFTLDYSKMRTDFDFMYNVEMLNQATRIRELELRIKELEGEK